MHKSTVNSHRTTLVLQRTRLTTVINSFVWIFLTSVHWPLYFLHLDCCMRRYYFLSIGHWKRVERIPVHHNNQATEQRWCHNRWRPAGAPWLCVLLRLSSFRDTGCCPPGTAFVAQIRRHESLSQHGGGRCGGLPTKAATSSSWDRTNRRNCSTTLCEKFS